MVSFGLCDLRELMKKPRNIRNMSLIAQSEHGKKTLTRALLASAGLSFTTTEPDSGKEGQEDSSERSEGLRSAGNSLFCKVAPEEIADERLPKDSEGREFLIHLIDAPGHVDLSAQITAALRITDGALVVVDCIEGVSLQTETVLRQALGERIKPVVTINKLDRGFLELQLDWESFYINFSKQVEHVNSVISMYYDEALGDLHVYPHTGTVSFSAGLHGWGFTLTQFARLYAKKFGIEEGRMCERLWGDHFFLTFEKRWTKVGDPQFRAFNLFVLDPIGKIFSACMNDQVEKLNRMLSALNIKMKKGDLELTGKALLMRTMQNWLPVHKALLEMMILHLPSPCVAQRYRTELLYTGDQEDKCGVGMRACDPEAPLMLYVSKMVPSVDKGRFIAFGRVFSGTIRSGEKFRIMGPNYVVGKKDDLYVKSVLRIVLFLGQRQEAVDSVIAGNTCGLVGIDHFLIRTGTLSDSEEAFPLRDLKFSVSPVIRCVVEPKKPHDLPKLVAGLQRLAKSDPMASVSIEESGDHIIGGVGELHMEMCLRNLQEHYAAGVPLTFSEFAVTYRETVIAADPEASMSQSPNRHNRLYVRATPLGEELTNRIDSGEITPRDDVNIRAEVLTEKYRWESWVAHNVWAFGPDMVGPNLLVNHCRDGEQENLNEVKDSVLTGFAWVAKEGVLCEESLRGVHFAIVDATLHAETIHRGGGQIIPMARRVMYAAQLSAEPKLMEPVFVVEIQCTDSSLEAIQATLDERRGLIVAVDQRPGTPVYNLRAYLPVAESFGFDTDLRAETAGQAFPQCTFDHWQLVEGNPLQPGTLRDDIIAGIRRRKGIALDIPLLERYRDNDRGTETTTEVDPLSPPKLANFDNRHYPPASPTCAPP